MDDIRLDVGFFDHPKTKRLRRRLGIEGVIALLKLWIYASRYFPKGILTGLTAADVEETTEWSGTPGEFVPALVDAGGPGKAGFLDVGEGVFVLHNWKIRNRFAYFKPERSAQAQRANDARWSKIRKEKQEVNPDRTPDRTPDQNPPLPPPLPPPKSINTDSAANAAGNGFSPDDMAILWNEAVDFYAKDSDVIIPKILRLTDGRKKKATARIKDCGITRERWIEIVNAVHRSKFLSGKSPGKGHEDWKANFDFVLKSQETVTKILEGGYS